MRRQGAHHRGPFLADVPPPCACCAREGLLSWESRDGKGNDRLGLQLTPGEARALAAL